MFAYIDKVNKKVTPNIVNRNYYLTQGDSFSLTATPVNEGEKVIAKILFKMASASGTIFYEKQYDYDIENKVYVCNVTAEETAKWEITGDNDPYIYEIEVHFIDGGIETLRRAEFTIWEQSKEGE